MSSYLLGAFVVAAAIYQILVIVAAFRHLLQRDPQSADEPFVSILKPLRGRDPRLYEALESQARQQYLDFEILFAHSDPNEPALEDVRRLRENFPAIPIRSHRTTSQAPNGKVASLHDLSEEARGTLLVVSDSDIRVPAGYLKQVIAPLQDPTVGLVTCLYRAESDHLPGRWEALGISTDFAPSALVARLLGVNEFACGATLALRRDTLQRIGGFRSIQDYLADDYQLGKRISALGLRIWVSKVIVETQLSGDTWQAIWDHQVRWARTIRVSKGAGYAGLPIANASLWALIAAIWGWGPAAICLIALRIAAGLVAGVLVLECRQARRYWYLMPLRDLWGFAIWVWGLAGNRVVWRGEILKLRSDGKLV